MCLNMRQSNYQSTGQYLKNIDWLPNIAIHLSIYLSVLHLSANQQTRCFVYGYPLWFPLVACVTNIIIILIVRTHLYFNEPQCVYYQNQLYQFNNYGLWQHEVDLIKCLILS